MQRSDEGQSVNGVDAPEAHRPAEQITAEYVYRRLVEIGNARPGREEAISLIQAYGTQISYESKMECERLKVALRRIALPETSLAETQAIARHMLRTHDPNYESYDSMLGDRKEPTP